MPPCISANSFCPSSRGIHFNFTPLCPLLYSVLSTNWYILERRATLSASSCSSGSSPFWRKRTVRCAIHVAFGSLSTPLGTAVSAGSSVLDETDSPLENTLQFHTVVPSSVQCVVDELVHT